MSDAENSAAVEAAPRRAALKGVGAQSQPAPRFLDTRTEFDPEVLGTWTPDKAVAVTYEAARSIITRNRSPDIPFDRSINPYRGCEHGCVYCFARPAHAYVDLSPGIDFERKLFAKRGASALLRKALGARGYQPATIAIGTNTDPYQPLEKREGIMRELLQVFLEFQHPVSIVTKGALILRDLDLLAELASTGLVKVMVSVTTLDSELKARLEPRTAAPQRRLATLRALAAAGVPTGAMIAPVIPFINDHELEALVERCAEAGAGELNMILLRLPHEVAPLFEEWLQTHYPDRADRVLNAIRSARGGALYRANWGERMRGSGPVAELLGQRFRAARRRVGLAESLLPRLRTDRFRVPESAAADVRADPDPRQGELF